MKYLQSRKQFLLMHNWKKLLIASHYLNNRTQKLDSRNYGCFANSVLFSKLTLKLRVRFFGQVEIFSGKKTFDKTCPTGKLSKMLISTTEIILILHITLCLSPVYSIYFI